MNRAIEESFPIIEINRLAVPAQRFYLPFECPDDPMGKLRHFKLRKKMGCVPDFSFHHNVHARAWVRVEAVRESVRIIGEILETLPSGEISAEAGIPSPDTSGFSAVEGWRGEIIYWLQAGPKSEINRCMVRNPSSLNWLGLEQAVLGNIVPDFPLCNKSFNQSYSGHDL